nr:hypothetical protein [Oscillospiraceae bacterium]
LEPNRYTPDTLIEEFSFSYQTPPPEEPDIVLSENDTRVTDTIDAQSAKLDALADKMEQLEAMYPAINVQALNALLAQANEALDEETVEGVMIAAEANNEYRKAVETFTTGLNAYMTGCPLFSENGVRKDPAQTIRDVSSYLTGAEHVAHSAEYLAQNGYLAQQTQSFGTVYIRVNDDTVLMYYPEDELEVALAADSELPVSIESTSPPSENGGMSLLGLFGHHYTDHWDELDENNTEYEYIFDAATKVQETFAYVRQIGTLVLAFLGEIADVADKYMAYQQELAAAKNKLTQVDKITFQIEMKEALEQALGGGTDQKDMKQFITSLLETVDWDQQTLASLKNLTVRLESAMKDLIAQEDVLKSISKSGVTAATKFPTLSKVAHTALSGLDKVINSPVTSIAFTLYDLINGLFDISNSLATLSNQISNNLAEVRMAWLYRQGDVSEDCKDECEDLRTWLAAYRLIYKSHFVVVLEKFFFTLVGDIGSVIGVFSGTVGMAYAVSSFTVGSLSDLGVAVSETVVFKMVDYCWDCVVEECGMPKPKKNGDSVSSAHGGNDGGGGTPFPHKKHIDPAGFVYEAVASNRLEGVTVTAYYQDTGGNPALWDAAEYEQVNPLVTGADGAYEWYTPSGNWLVMAEKPGYHSASSAGDPEAVDGWLPVPPPQMNVNIGM